MRDAGTIYRATSGPLVDGYGRTAALALWDEAVAAWRACVMEDGAGEEWPGELHAAVRLGLAAARALGDRCASPCMVASGREVQS